jgi:hypothetical protein
MADVTETDYTTSPPTVVERDFTDAERAQIAADAQAAVDAAAAVEAAAVADAAARAAVLERLGISEDEARLLLKGF